MGSLLQIPGKLTCLDNKKNYFNTFAWNLKFSYGNYIQRGIETINDNYESSLWHIGSKKYLNEKKKCIHRFYANSCIAFEAFNEHKTENKEHENALGKVDIIQYQQFQ